MHYIGIDLGASFVKAARLDTTSGEISRIEKIPAPDHVAGQGAGAKELDPEQVWAAVRGLIKHVGTDWKIDGILVSNQMHGFIILDGTGKAVTRYITWQDQRGSDQNNMASVREAFGEDGLRRTGMPLLPGLPSLNLHHLCHHDGVKSGRFLSLGDFICHRLCGNVLVHRSNCAGSGLMDLKKDEWNTDALEAMKCSGFEMPDIASDFSPVGISDEFDGAAVFAAIGDQQAALLGAMIDDGDLSLNVGTGSQVSMLSHELVFGKYQTRPFFSGDYLKTVTHIPAGRALNVIVAFSKDLISKVKGLETTDEEFWRAYGQIDPSMGDLEVDLSFFTGSASGDQGSICNIHEGKFTMSDVLAAGYRRMAQNYRDFSIRIGGETASQIIVSGGLLSKNGALRQAIQENFHPLPLVQRYSEDTLVGLYVIARAHETGAKNFRNVYDEIGKQGLFVLDT